MIHQYKMFNQNIVLDICSGSIHVVDEIAYDMIAEFLDKDKNTLVLEMKEKYPSVETSELEECYDQITELKEQGRLFSEDTYEPMAGQLKAKTSGVIKALCLHIAHTCNLNCSYCFASQGKYHGDRALMSFETGKRALDFLVENSGTRRNLEVDFFGGEPLMNFDVVKQLVEYGRSIEKENNKNIRFTITTNGILLDDEKIEYINENMHNVVLSLDGRKEVNDNVRIKVDGSGSYDDILPNIKRMIEKRDKSKHYYVRGTFTGANTDFYEDVKAMVNEGFREISIEPVVLEKGHFLELKEEHLPEIFENYDKLYNEMVRRKKEGDEFNFYHFNIDLNGGPCVYKRISGCGAGFEYVAITPQGEVYPCHQFVGKEEFKLGDIYDDTYDAELGKKFKKAHIYNKPKCRECWARFYCSGGCQSNNFAFNGDMNIPYEIGCKMQKKRIECAIALKAE